METENNSIAHTHFVESVAYLLRETFEGSPEGLPSAYLDRGASGKPEVKLIETVLRDHSDAYAEKCAMK